MRIQNRIDYAVRALVVMAMADGLCSRDQIATRSGVPGAYLGSLLLQMRTRQLVVSSRGPNGGYRLERPAATITLADVLSALDDIDVAYDPASPLASTWDQLHRAWLDAADDITLESLIPNPT